MTDISPQNLPRREAGTGTAGAGPGHHPGRSGLVPGRPLPPFAGDPASVLVAVHGILTKSTDASWPASLADWTRRSMTHPPRMVASDYYELPLPRLAALRNPARARELHAEATRAAREVRAEFSHRPTLDLVTHSNGGVLALQMLRERSMVWRGGHWVLIAPALRRGGASREIGEMIRDGRLSGVTLVRPLRDRTLAFAGRRRIATWPWGDLGLSGWDLDALGEVPAGAVSTIDLPEAGHSDPLRPGSREWTFSTIVDPALGLTQPRAEHFDMGGGL